MFRTKYEEITLFKNTFEAIKLHAIFCNLQFGIVSQKVILGLSKSSNKARIVPKHSVIGNYLLYFLVYKGVMQYTKEAYFVSNAKNNNHRTFWSLDHYEDLKIHNLKTVEG